VNVIHKYEYNNTKSENSNIMDVLQEDLECCGSKNMSDWHENKSAMLVPLPDGKYPKSCCKEAEDDKEHNAKLCFGTEKSKMFEKGCLNVLDEKIRYAFGLLGGIAIAIAIIQLFGIVFACCLGRSIRKEYEVV